MKFKTQNGSNIAINDKYFIQQLNRLSKNNPATGMYVF